MISTVTMTFGSVERQLVNKAVNDGVHRALNR